MKKWMIVYYKTHNFVTHKIIMAKSSSDAIKKSRVKYIIDLKLVEEDL
jgi:hypothetical protein